MSNLRSAVDEVLAQDPHDLADAALADDLVELRRQIDRLEAAFTRRLAAFDARSVYVSEGQGSSAAWLRNVCRLAAGDAAVRVRTARRWRDGQADVAAALADGAITWIHARVLSEHVGRTCERLLLAHPAGADPQAVHEVVAAAELILVDAARELDPTDTARVARRWQHTVDPDGFDLDAERLHDARHLHVSATWGGMVRIDGELDPEGGQVLIAAIDALAAPTDSADPRQPAQRRADALVELSRRALDRGALPEHGGDRPHVVVEVTLDSLERRLGARPGELARTGPISSETARRLACDAGITRLITGADSEPLDVGRKTRVIPTAIRRALVHRDRGCRWPGCDYPAQWTDAHHIQHWADGGPTSLGNLVLLCRRHHRAVHEGHQPIERPPPD